MNTYVQTMDVEARAPSKHMINAADPRPTILFEFDDGSQIEARLVDNALVLCSTSFGAEGLSVQPIVSNVIHVRTRRVA